MKKGIYYFFALGLLFTSCDDTETSGEEESNANLEILAGINVRQEFQRKSPIAQEIGLQLLDKPLSTGENILLTATFDKRNIERIEESFLALQFGKEKAVLRDDGKGADEKAGDGIFSINIEQDVDQLIKDLSRAKKQSLSGKNPKFSARSITKLDNKLLNLFSPDELKLKNRIIIPSAIFPFPVSPAAAPPFPILVDESLMIIHTDVVEDPTKTFNPCDMDPLTAGDPRGVWSFGELMRQMASPNPGAIASDAATVTFVLDWLNTWNVANTINGDNIPSRGIGGVINDWQTFSDQANLAAGNPIGPLLVERLPFKLTAIVNRLDLRGNSGYGFSNAGEGRLVFCLLNTNCTPLEFNVIFEYGINKKTCPAVKAFGQEWADLSDPALVLGSAAYNNQLAAITAQFTMSGTNTSNPNQSSINQVRSNEFAIGTPWELREFNLTTSLKLEMVDVKMEPARKFNTKNPIVETQELADFANTNEVDILANNYDIPLVFNGANFRGGASHTNFPPTGNANVGLNTPHHWDGEVAAPFLINNNDARHILSLNTCSGCHGGETQTFFTHIDPAPFGTPAGLSGFLTGISGRGGAIDADGAPGNNIMTVSDPAGRPLGAPALRGFNDLQRRLDDLNVLVNQNCLSISAIGIANILLVKPMIMTH